MPSLYGVPRTGRHQLLPVLLSISGDENILNFRQKYLTNFGSDMVVTQKLEIKNIWSLLVEIDTCVADMSVLLEQAPNGGQWTVSSVQTALHREPCRLQTSHHRGDGQDKGDYIDTVNSS